MSKKEKEKKEEGYGVMSEGSTFSSSGQAISTSNNSTNCDNANATSESSLLDSNEVTSNDCPNGRGTSTPERNSVIMTTKEEKKKKRRSTMSNRKTRLALRNEAIMKSMRTSDGDNNSRQLERRESETTGERRAAVISDAVVVETIKDDPTEKKPMENEEEKRSHEHISESENSGDLLSSVGFASTTIQQRPRLGQSCSTEAKSITKSNTTTTATTTTGKEESALTHQQTKQQQQQQRQKVLHPKFRLSKERHAQMYAIHEEDDGLDVDFQPAATVIRKSHPPPILHSARTRNTMKTTKTTTKGSVTRAKEYNTESTSPQMGRKMEDQIGYYQTVTVNSIPGITGQGMRSTRQNLKDASFQHDEPKRAISPDTKDDNAQFSPFEMTTEHQQYQKQQQQQQQQQQKKTLSKTIPSAVPVLLSKSIMERPIHQTYSSITTTTTETRRVSVSSNREGRKPKKSQFKLQQQQQQQKQRGDDLNSSFVKGTNIGGFPSLDLPIGTFVPKKKTHGSSNSSEGQTMKGIEKNADAATAAMSKKNGIAKGDRGDDAGAGAGDDASIPSQEYKHGSNINQNDDQKEEKRFVNPIQVGDGDSDGSRTRTDSKTQLLDTSLFSSCGMNKGGVTNRCNDNITMRGESTNDILAGISHEEIMDGIAEIESVLSLDAIAFLRKRGAEKMMKSKLKEKQRQPQQQQEQEKQQQSRKHQLKMKAEEHMSAMGGTMGLSELSDSAVVNVSLIADEEQDGVDRKRSRDAKRNDSEINIAAKDDQYTTKNEQESHNVDETVEKERFLKDLSSIRTLEELDDAVAASQITDGTTVHSTQLADHLGGDDGRDKLESDELTEATKLLRSTARQQRFLGAKTVCEILDTEITKLRTITSSASSTSGLRSAETYPPYLPVALRCLLDVPSPHKHQLLLSYVLRSLYSLLILFAHPDHRVYVTPRHGSDDAETDATSIYQLHFMDDDVPTPPLEGCYYMSPSPIVKPVAVAGRSDLEGACYATDSSAETATSDARAFYSDPMWTLLSRMRILPRLSAILQWGIDVDRSSGHSRQHDSTWRLPDESLMAICGILAMLSVRSPGAACAIAQHKQIMPLIIECTLSPGGDEASACTSEPSNMDKSLSIRAERGEEKFHHDGEAAVDERRPSGFVVNARVALPSIILLCTMARQSRSVASLTILCEDVISHLQAILGMPAESDEEYEVQRWSLIFWRTLLRYGLAMPHLSTLLSLSIRHMTVVRPTRHSLAVEYSTAFANVCDCARIVTGRIRDYSGSEPNITLTPDQKESLAMAGMWLSSPVQQGAEYLQSISKDRGEEKYSWQEMRLTSARVRLLSAYSSASGPTDLLRDDEAEEKTNTESLEKIRGTFVPVLQKKSCVMALESLWQSGIIEYALRLVLKYAYVMDWDKVLLRRVRDGSQTFPLEEEASACALLEGYVSLLSTVSRGDKKAYHDNDEETANIASSLVIDLRETILSILKSQEFVPSRIHLSTECLPSYPDVHNARIGWLNRAHFALCRFAAASFVPNSDDMQSALPVLRTFAFSLIGRLRRGEEAAAAILLSQDFLFQTFPLEKNRELPLSTSNVESVSTLSSVLMKELCASRRSQVQLDHSFKLQRGFGITPSGLGAFALDSLRSEADFQLYRERAKNNGGENEDNQPSNLLIPLGKLWLWHVLSSSVCVPQNRALDGPVTQDFTPGQAAKGISDVVVSCLQLLQVMENDGIERCRSYVKQVYDGTKLYHLVNTCLYPEQVLRDERLGPIVSDLFDKYTEALYRSNGVNRMDTTENTSLVRTFISACFEHSRQPVRGRDRMHRSFLVSGSKADEQEQKLLSLFDNRTEEKQSCSISTEEVRALNDFLDDLCTSYLEYGAQYESFTKCIRFFLQPGFPPKTVSELILRLRDVLHLLTLKEESEESSGFSMFKLLAGSISDGLDASYRDPAEVLDTMSLAMKGSGNGNTDSRLTASRGGYFYLLVIAFLARSLAVSLNMTTHGLESSKRRMKGLSVEVLSHIVGTATQILSSKTKTKHDVARSVVNVCIKKEHALHDLDGWASGGYDDKTWDIMIETLRRIDKGDVDS